MTTIPARGTRPTRSEIKVLAGIARGHTTRQTAAHLGLSPNTVRVHCWRISRRLGTHGRAGTIGAAYRAGYLTDLPPEPRPPVTLTRRSRQALQSLADGLSDAQAAERLNISLSTLRDVNRRLYTALQASNRGHAVALGYQHGHLPLPRAQS